MASQTADTLRKRNKHSEIEPVDQIDDQQEDKLHRNHSEPKSRVFLQFGLIVAALILPAIYYKLFHRGVIIDNYGQVLMSKDELARYAEGEKIYLGLMGQVFDVTGGREHYEPKGSYHVFSGRDASRAFITGDFLIDLHDDVEDFTPELFAELVGWRDFYANHKVYKPVGKVYGKFYDAKGRPTQLLALAETLAEKHRQSQVKEEEKKDKLGQVPCNVQWSRTEGGYVYCLEGPEGTKKYPRKVMLPDSAGVLRERCACFSEPEISPSRQLYEGCEATSDKCMTSKPGEE